MNGLFSFAAARPAAVAPGRSEIARKNAEDCKNRGNAHLARGDVQAAIACYREATSADPLYAEVHNNLGLALSQAGRTGEALAAFRRALDLKPGLAQAHYNVGRLLHDQGCLDEAASSLENATRLKPDFAEAHNHLGILDKERGRLQDALDGFQRAAAVKPDFASAWYNLGLALHEAGKAEEATAALRRALALEPAFAEAYGALGLVQHEQGEMDEALTSLSRALSLDSDNADILNNLGLLFQDRGQPEEAAACFEKALSRAPGEDWRAFNLALPLLALGRLSEGWSHFEHRFAKRGGLPKRSFPYPLWRGEDLAERRLLIWSELSVGDEILFASLFPDVIDRAEHCVIECTPKLAPLFTRSFPRATVVSSADPPHRATQKNVDRQVSAGGLAQWLRPSLESFPRRTSYLTPDAKRVAYWKARLAALGPGPKIGFCWRSSIRNGRRRFHYTKLDQWGPIFTVPGVHFINLQYDECTAELAAARELFRVSLHAFPEVDLRDDIDESAALTQALDLVVSAPTATSGLAAALGVPTWELSHGVNWAALGTNHLPWLPTLRLYARGWDQPWHEIVATVATELKEIASSID